MKVATEQQTEGVDKVILGMDLQYGLGFMVPSSILMLGGESSFGHYGAGGSVGFADPDAEIGFGYVMNRMGPHIADDPRKTALVEAVYSAL